VRVLSVTGIPDVVVAGIGAGQALLLGYLAYRSQQNGKKATAVADVLDTQVAASLLATQTAVQEVTQEVFHARQEHTSLAGKIDEVHTQVHELRGDVASLAERLDVHAGDRASQ
jgi:chromosome segregation ATPase